MIDFSGAQPVWPAAASALWRECAAEAAGQASSFTRSEAAGDELLRAQFGHQLGAAADEITIVSGARAAAAAYGFICRRIAIERPTFTGVVSALTGARTRWAYLSWSELSSVPMDTTVWVTSPYRNPDGATLSPAQHRCLAERCGAGGRAVINSTYQWFAGGYPACGPDAVLSLHKLAGRGARIAAVRSRTFAREASDILPYLSPPLGWQRMWARFLSRGGLEVLRAAHIHPVRQAAAAFRGELGGTEAVPGLPADASPHVMLPLRAGVKEEIAAAALIERGFKVGEGRHFAALRPAIRVCFSGVGPAEAAALARTLRSADLLEPSWPGDSRDDG